LSASARSTGRELSPGGRLERPPGVAFATIALSGALTGAAPAGGKPKNEQVTPVVVRASGGFDWGDAAIGAGAGVGAALAAIGGITLARNR
jgi:hypothetical protein